MKKPEKAKIDAFLAMRGIFGAMSDEGASGTVGNLESFDDLSAFDPAILSEMSRRAGMIRALDNEQRRIWAALWLERLRRRGRTAFLDPNVHAEQVAEILKTEPPSIRSIIETHLPGELAARVTIILQGTYGESGDSFPKRKRAEAGADPRLVGIVRTRFLTHFVAFEDLIEPAETDSYTTIQLGNFIWNLGLREIARFCRGIEKIENLAGFLQRFEDETGKAIGLLIPDMKDVEISRVRQAEKRVMEVFGSEEVSDDEVRRVGMLVFAEALSGRSNEAIRFSLQKLPVLIDREVSEYVESARKRQDRLSDSVADEVLAFAADSGTGGN